MDRILIIDTSAIMYRSHFALMGLVNSKGVHTGATLGLVRQISKYIEKIKPKYAIAAKDVKRSTLYRSQIYSEYKTNRVSMPQELVEQLEYIYEIIENFGILPLSSSGYEADDVIGSMTNYCVRNNIEVHIVTGDKDIQQLIDDDKKIFIHLLGKDDLIVNNREDVKSNLLVYPEQIPDFFGLKGDSSDGIPGIHGIGDKTASSLIEKYGNLDNIYNNIDNISGKLKEKLINGKEIAYISKNLATINKDIDFGITLDDLIVKQTNNEKLKEIFEILELKSLFSILKEEKKEIQIKYVDVDDIYNKLKNKSKVYIYEDEYNIAINNNDNIYFITKQSKDNLFSKSFEYEKLEKTNEYILCDAKSFIHKGLNLEDNFFDIELSAYVLNTEQSLQIDDLILNYIGFEITKVTKKSEQKDYEKRLQEIIYNLPRLEQILRNKLNEEDTQNTYEIIEKPLVKVLYDMEKQGVLISKEKFFELEQNFSKEINLLTNKIYELAGENFNIDSPKQLGVILFEKMGYPIIKKSKTGYSTDVTVLEKLANQNVEIAKYLLEYRSIKKLLSSYIIPIPQLVKEDGRIRSSFNGTITATGRLSSNNPNLQNIPTRTKEGSMIRSCFVAKKGYKLVSFDYSQIELRVLAFLSKDKQLLDAYANDLDLHTLTAQKLFVGEPIDKQKRNLAKVINFSVLYGKTPFGLKEELNISMQQAKQYIDKYFEEYSSVMPYLESIADFARKITMSEHILEQKDISVILIQKKTMSLVKQKEWLLIL